VAHRVAGGAEHQRAAGVEVAQHVDHRMLDLARRDADRAVLDVAVRRVALADGVDACASRWKVLARPAMSLAMVAENIRVRRWPAWPRE
jgi:hypothetical protein